MDEETEDFVYFGTPIEREEDTSARKRKAVADAGSLRSLPSWKQEVTDEEGRRRFHGAFTGGFSAGYYNTVGSKEGWTPQTFVSSRKNRAEVKKQSIYSFLDDEDIKDMGGHGLETSMQFDTFGFTAAEVARKQAEKEQKKRPSVIPGPAPDELVLPATNSIGMKLLLKMGWRHGRSIAEANRASLYDARREARKAFLALSANAGEIKTDDNEVSAPDSEDFSNAYTDAVSLTQRTPSYVLKPKQDLQGLGYDPFKHAPEFRESKRLRESRIKDRKTMKGRYAPGFGIGALEELDVEDEDIYASAFEPEATEVEEDEPSKLTKGSMLALEQRKNGFLSSFKIASFSGYNLERFHPPVIPPDFVPVHKFPFALDSKSNFSEAPPPEVPPPEDDHLRLLIEGFAKLVARCGKLFEDVSREKNKTNPLFAFLNGGNGHTYYGRKLWEERQKHSDKQKQLDIGSSSVPKMTAESRGRILGERPLERSSAETNSSNSSKEVIHLQSNLLDTFTKPSSIIGFAENIKPFKEDPAKQERFEQFLKDKYQGGLRSWYSVSAGNLSEADRARERLDFEAAAESIEKRKLNASTNLPSSLALSENQFVASTTSATTYDKEKEMEKTYPKREEFQWRPSPILCKRFDIMDPFMGKPAPLPRARSRMDTLIFMPDILKNLEPEKPGNSAGLLLPELKESEKQTNSDELEIEPVLTDIQRPVDLYKAIFSDDSDDEGNGNISSQQEKDSEKKNEGANTTLNRLIAGDFLESLGKELGLEVPPESDRSTYRTESSSMLAEVPDGEPNTRHPQPTESSKTFHLSTEPMGNKIVEEPYHATFKEDISRTSNFKEADCIRHEVGNREDRYRNNSSRRWRRNSDSEYYESLKDRDNKAEAAEHRSSKHRTKTSRHRSRSRGSGSDSDSSSGGRHRSRRSRSRERKHSRERSRRHRKHDKDKLKRSPSRYARN